MPIDTFARLLMAAALAVGLAAPRAAEAMPGDHEQAVEYGKVGGWTLRRVVANGRVVSCDTFALFASETGLSFSYDRGSKSLGFSDLGSAASDRPLDVELWFDDRRSDARHLTMSLEPDAAGWSWRRLHSSNDEPDGLFDDSIRHARTIHFAYVVEGMGKVVRSQPLAGFRAAQDRTIACVIDAAAKSPAKP